ncbi:hypothetical protein C8F04DRAFT_1281651 [Mycena alexandri]|uniref:Uncharacterized protein n=1 Tax=Mycena alexandri TaxID=1745969 RepID=A0AAD6RWN9_9AGAR|nr:hypothetical protein C8F04DRAFT_1281651 [Mycena alexandri]
MTAEERAVGCIAGVDLMEGMARDAQCSAALIKLRNQLHMKARLMTYKKNHARHQAANTRSRTLVERNESKIKLHSEKYQSAWSALRALSADDALRVGWRRREATRRTQEQRSRRLRRRLVGEGELRADDDGGEADAGWEDDEDGETVRNPNENRREISWIWTVAGEAGSDAELEEALRIEWAKAYARVRRWTEEVALLEEEYRRVLVSFEYEAGRWEQRLLDVRVGSIREERAEGQIAYARRQADMYRTLAERATTAWTEVHIGRGKKRIQRLPTLVKDDGDVDPKTDNIDPASDDEEDSDGDGVGAVVHSDEEHLLGGDEDMF